MALNDQSVLEYDEQVLNFSNAGLFEADTRGAWEHASANPVFAVDDDQPW